MKKIDDRLLEIFLALLLLAASGVLAYSLSYLYNKVEQRQHRMEYYQIHEIL